ncbi:MAG: ATP-binding protein [Caldilineaceae bacterium]
MNWLSREPGGCRWTSSPSTVATLDHVVSAFRSATAQKDVTLDGGTARRRPGSASRMWTVCARFSTISWQRCATRPPAAIRTGAAEADACASLWRTTVPGIVEDLGRILRTLLPGRPQPPGMPTPAAGLGLTIVKALVEMQGGDVGVESASEGPTTFWFTLPRYTP